MAKETEISKLKMHSPDLSQENIAKIRELFPGCVTEAKDQATGAMRLAVDFDQLRQELSDQIVEGPQERYRLDWPGKREALALANAPIAKTLRPCRGESVDFDTTQNLFIEGDNLESLKLLQENYLGKVKVIYIDPPYNTGNDFVYEDDFSESSADYLGRSNQKDDEGNWSFSSELRIGPGSFTDTANNSTGDQLALHKAWIGWQLNESQQIIFGKSQAPFGWKTVNFWPGDILLAGYGDQMDVGVKLTGDLAPFNYDLAYYHADDWGSTSTDTVDDNGHWGSSTTYRKVQTLVVNGQWEFVENHKLGLSLQAGKLQDLSGNPDRPTSGDHQASVIYYEGSYGDFYAKASFIDQSRDLPVGHVNLSGLPAAEISNQRFAAEIGYKTGPWNFYLDASSAKPDTRQSTASTVAAFAPGFSYDYGPGWIYLEILTQDGFVDRNGQVGEGDFDALYVSFDFYL